MLQRMPLPIRLWFVLDLVLALLPPLHWAVGTGDLVLGVPRVLAYLWSLSLFIAASIVTAYLIDPARERTA